MRSAFEYEPRWSICPKQGREDRLQDEARASGCSDRKVVIAGLGLARHEADLGRSDDELVAFTAYSASGFHGGHVLPQDPRTLAVAANVRHGEGMSRNQRQRQGCAQDLTATFASRSIDLDHWFTRSRKN
jgi:hypothetical protein